MSSKTNVVKNYLQLLGTFFLYSISGVFAKIAATQNAVFKTLIFMGLEFFLLGVYALIWQQVLKKFELTVAMSCKGITVIYAMVWSIFLFKEAITLWNIIGAALVVIGIWVVSTDD